MESVNKATPTPNYVGLVERLKGMDTGGLIYKIFNDEIQVFRCLEYSVEPNGVFIHYTAAPIDYVPDRKSNIFY